MTKIDILNPKLIVLDDYRQFWVHFEGFLALFHISEVVGLTSVVFYSPCIVLAKFIGWVVGLRQNFWCTAIYWV